MAFLDRDRPWLLYVAAPAVAVAGPPILIVNIQVANMYSQGASMLIGLFTGIYDASAIIQMLVKVCYFHGITLRMSYIAISVLLLILVGSSFWVFPKTYIPRRLKMELKIVKEENIEAKVQQADEEGCIDKNDPESAFLRISSHNIQPSLTECMKSKLYLFHVFWLSVLQLRFYFYVGSLNSFLEYRTNSDKLAVNQYTNLSLYIQTGGILCAPFIGCFLDFQRHRYRGGHSRSERLYRPTILPLFITCFVALFLSAIMLMGSTYILIPMFCIFTVFRAFLYGLVAAYIQMIFPVRYFGTLWGMTMVIGGLFSAFQYPIFIWLDVEPVGPKKVNILLLVVTLFALIHPMYIWWMCRRLNQQPRSVNINNPSEKDTDVMTYHCSTDLFQTSH